ncbi:hypothetical protein C1645_743401 [Glomus cerebriforme]|uniref:Uncharacterized protein n=1 Tax=Glomus cerebriforme TaxID=658196 RepID=A0A397SK82_9GLOM|nr:hypothetical protein C1645_743401 [Glomus cerebriforme]
MERETVLLAFGLVREIGERFFSFLIDSPSVRALGIRKRFLNFISGSGFFLISAWKSGLLLDLRNQNIWLWGFGIGNIWLWDLGLETFSSGDSGLETFGSGNLGLEINVLTERFFSFVDLALESETETDLFNKQEHAGGSFLEHGKLFQRWNGFKMILESKVTASLDFRDEMASTF